MVQILRDTKPHIWGIAKKILCLCAAFIYFNITIAFGQNIIGDSIQVSSQSLTVLKFNAPVTHYDFGTRNNYTCQVRDNDNSLVIKAIGNNPVSTNLYVNEGKRAHIFLIVFLPQVDINKIKLYYDYSDLRELKAHVAAKHGNDPNANVLAFVDTAKPNADAQKNTKKKLSKAEKKELEKKQQEERDAETARLAQLAAEEVVKAAEIARKRQNDSIAAMAVVNKAKNDKAAADAKKQKVIDDAKRLIKAKEDAVKALKAQQEIEAELAKAEKQAKLQKVIDDQKVAADAANAKQAQKAEAAKLAQAEKEAKLQKAIADAKVAADSAKVVQAKRDDAARLQKAAKTEEEKKAVEDAKIKIEAARLVQAQKAEEARLATEAKHKEDLEKAKADDEAAKVLQAEKEAAAKVAREEKAAQMQKEIDDKKTAIAAAKVLKAQKEEEARIVMQAKLQIEIENAKAEEAARQIALKTETERKKQVADSIAAIPKTYSHLELWKKYPKISFEAPPNGQTLSIDFLNPKDTLENSNVSYKLLSEKPTLSESSDTVAKTSFALEAIAFSGINCYMKLRIRNQSPNDYLVGPINLKWFRSADTAIVNLLPCYITSFPVVLPKTNRTIVLVTRAANMKNSDQLILTLGDRLKKINLELAIPTTLYNREMNK